MVLSGCLPVRKIYQDIDWRVIFLIAGLVPMGIALESSGVEQFQPELNSDFHGQEKIAEALKEKQPTKKPEQAGRIARVIRPGYRYLIDDENYRIVRTAQVKLYG